MTVSSNQSSNDNGNEGVMATVDSDQSIQSEKNSKGKQQMVHVPCLENKMDSLSSGNMGNGIGKEYANSSSSGKPPDSPNGSSSSTPKPKKRKGGKKKRDGASSRHGDECKLTIVYGSNSYQDRRELWHYLDLTSDSNATVPWAIMGDFNASLRPSDRSGGSNVWGTFKLISRLWEPWQLITIRGFCRMLRAAREI
ncbi:hypothetical protein OIU76_025410 [Salix suchowensis]|nr:hypothetical protein OIU76_025410 [Salix suchowensis]